MSTELVTYDSVNGLQRYNGQTGPLFANLPNFTTSALPSAPPFGTLVLNTTTNKLNFFGTDSAWHAVTSA